MNIKLSFLSLILFLFGSNLIGQDMEQGYIKMEITDVEVEDEAMKMVVDMMKGTETEYIFTKEQSLVKANMMGGMMVMNTLINNEDESVVLFFDAMGNKMKVTADKSEMDEQSKETPFSDASIEYFEKDTKEILGYECMKAVAKSPGNDAMEITMYVTPDIKASSSMIQGMDKLDLKGFPLEYIMNVQGMKMTYTTVEMENEVAKNAFEINEEGYKTMTMEEFSKTMEGMGGF